MVNKNETTNSEKKPIIDNDEALRLIDLIQQGDSNAENELAELGSVFVKAVARQYVDKGLSDEELIAASRYGMLRASHKFDKSRGFKFASYAVWWMRQAILQEIRKKKITKTKDFDKPDEQNRACSGSAMARNRVLKRKEYDT